MSATTTTTELVATPSPPTTTEVVATNTTVAEQTQWEFLLTAFIILIVSAAFCGCIIFICKSQTREARRRREEELQQQEEEREKLEKAFKAKQEEEAKLHAEREEQIQREIEEQEEIEAARKEGREVDPVYRADDIFYADVRDVPVVLEHPSSMVETGTGALDHLGNPKPRAGDALHSQVKTSDALSGMTTNKEKKPPVVMGMKVINGVDFYRNMYDKTVAQQEAREHADKSDTARKAAQPWSYRKKAKRDTIGLGEDFAGGAGGGGGDAGAAAAADRGPMAVIQELPWLGKQNLSAFDPDAFEKAFADLPDDDEQEELEKKRVAAAADMSQSLHARSTGVVLADGQGSSPTAGGGGGSKMSLLEAPLARRAREEAEAAARRHDMIERQKYERQLELSKKPVKKGQPRVMPPSEQPLPTAKRLVIPEHMKFEKDKYYDEML